MQKDLFGNNVRKVIKETGRKHHKGCGGVVVWRQSDPDSGVHYEYAGYCLKCKYYPISQEDIEFETVEEYERN